MKLEQEIFLIISSSGDAKSYAMEAISHAKQGDFESAQSAIESANEKLAQAHKQQTKLIQAEASGGGVEVSLLLIHAQDHLMNTITIRDLAIEFVDLYNKINQ